MTIKQKKQKKLSYAVLKKLQQQQLAEVLKLRDQVYNQNSQIGNLKRKIESLERELKNTEESRISYINNNSQLSSVANERQAFINTLTKLLSSAVGNGEVKHG